MRGASSRGALPVKTSAQIGSTQPLLVCGAATQFERAKADRPTSPLGLAAKVCDPDPAEPSTAACCARRRFRIVFSARLFGLVF